MSSQPSPGSEEAELTKAIANLPDDEQEEVMGLLNSAVEQRSSVAFALSLTDDCWQKCGLGDNLASDDLADREKICVNNCVGRFIDMGSAVVEAASSQGELNGEADSKGEQQGKQ